MKKTIRDYDLEGKKVIIRVDFNVPIKEGIIKDDNRIVESLRTINYAIEHGAKVILMSHLGRVKEEADLIKNNLEPVSRRLAELINKDVIFVNATRGEKLERAINNLQNGDVLLMQNTRYEDLDGKKESKNDPELGAYWASLGDIYINDAFGTAHRAHASNVGIASILPNGVGFLIEEELNAFDKVTNNPERPYTVVLGGSKVSDKIEVIQHLVETADNILIGGGMMYTFLKAQGYEIGKSLLEEEFIDFCKEMLEKYANLVSDIEEPLKSNFYPESIRSSFALCALYDNFTQNEEYALALHESILTTKQDHFRGDLIKERQIKGGIYQVIRKFELNLSREEQMKKVEAIYEVVKEQDEY